jgi:hypothetical protein
LSLLLLLLLLPKRSRHCLLLARLKPSGSLQERRGLLGERGGRAACTSHAKPLLASFIACAVIFKTLALIGLVRHFCAIRVNYHISFSFIPKPGWSAKRLTLKANRAAGVERRSRSCTGTECGATESSRCGGGIE